MLETLPMPTRLTPARMPPMLSYEAQLPSTPARRAAWMMLVGLGISYLGWASLSLMLAWSLYNQAASLWANLGWYPGLRPALALSAAQAILAMVGGGLYLAMGLRVRGGSREAARAAQTVALLNVGILPVIVFVELVVLMLIGRIDSAEVVFAAMVYPAMIAANLFVAFLLKRVMQTGSAMREW